MRLFLLLIIDLYKEILAMSYETNLYSIKLKIKGTGYNNIFGKEGNLAFKTQYYPNDIIINGINQTEKTYIYYFNKTDNLVELYWNNKIRETWNMFRRCYNITEIDLSNFDTSEVRDMGGMFMFCSLITSLNISHFDTSKVINLNRMFYGCAKLTSIDVSNFNTASFKNLNEMFRECTSLTSLNLSNFDTSLVTSMFQMFFDCINLEYINLKKFNEVSLDNTESSYRQIFVNVPENVVICLNENTNGNRILNQIKEKKCYTLDCSDDWKSKQKKIINKNGSCINSCEDSQIYKYEFNGKCYENCTYGYLNDNLNNIMNKCKCVLDKCSFCSEVALSNNLCTNCSINYYQIENDPTNIGEYVNCYKEPEGYYFDSLDNLYKKCFYKCKTCDIKGDYTNNNCLKCNDNYPFRIESNGHANCYENCSNYFFFDNINKNYHCTIDLNCPNDYPKLIEHNLECIKYDIKNIMEDIPIKEKNKTKIESKEEEIKYYDNILELIEKNLISQNFNTSNIDNGEDEIIMTEKMIVTLTTTQNQRNNLNKNTTTIDLGECETLLRNYYNISNNESLYMKKIDVFQEGTKTPKIEYNVYSKVSGGNLIKLNLKVCGNSKISISIPIEITENIDKLNSSSGYYNNICYTTTSEDGTDISLKDRQKEFVDKNKMVCQEDCEFSEYNYTTLKAKCTCKVKESPSSIAEMNFDKAKLLKNFYNIKSFSNFKFLVCYKNLFKKEGILDNKGSYVILTIILFHIIAIIIFYIHQFPLIKKKIKNIIYKINEDQLMNNDENKQKEDFELNVKYKRNNISIYTKDKKIKKKKKNISDSKNINNKRRKKINSKNKSVNKKIIMKSKNEVIYIDEEINALEYNFALKYDKRNYCNYYISLLKTKHNLIFAFCNNMDYNSKIIKIDLFVIGFVIDFAINTLFYDDETMHNIYKSKGNFDFETQIPIIVYSTLISMVLNVPLNFLALSNDAILSFKQEKIKINIKKRAKDLKYKLNIKFIIYFIISFLLLDFFWYYISMFCAIYKNTQIHLLKDTLYSFGLSLLFPFVIYLIPGFFRLPSLSVGKNTRKCLYNFSKILQSF